MAPNRNTQPPATADGRQEGEAGRSALPDEVAGAENAQGITPQMRSGLGSIKKLDSGPKRGEKDELLPATYKSDRGFIRQDR